MTESEILSNLEFVIDRLLELQEWDSSKKIQQIKNYIIEESTSAELNINRDNLPNEIKAKANNNYTYQMGCYLMPEEPIY